VAAQAAHFPASGGVLAGVNGLHDVAMAAAAGVLGYVAAGVGDFNVVRKISGSEIKRMKEAIAGFDRIFAREVVRCMAVIASSGVLVTSFNPAIVLRIHHMAVGTGLWIVG
jgi:hypothetical protein